MDSFFVLGVNVERLAIAAVFHNDYGFRSVTYFTIF